MTLAQIIVTTGGLVIQGAASIELRTPFAQPLPFSGPVEQSPFAQPYLWPLVESLSMTRAPLEHVASFRAGESVTIPASAFKHADEVQVVVDGEVVYVTTGYRYRYADVSGDGAVDAIDLDWFTAWWLAGDIRSDISGDGFSDGIDMDTFTNSWLKGGE